MKHVDAVRGFQRNILFSPDGLYTVSGANPLTNCVVEAVEDWNGGAPVLSLRFFDKPSALFVDEETPIGTEINLGFGMAQSLVQQISEKWPELLRLVQDAESEEGSSDSV